MRSFICILALLGLIFSTTPAYADDMAGLLCKEPGPLVEFLKVLEKDQAYAVVLVMSAVEEGSCGRVLIDCNRVEKVAEFLDNSVVPCVLVLMYVQDKPIGYMLLPEDEWEKASKAKSVSKGFEI